MQLYHQVTKTPWWHNQENAMTTQISSKLAALAVALMINSMIFGGVAYLFNSEVQHASVPSLAEAAPTAQTGAV
jgi:hypothetical protein